VEDIINYMVSYKATIRDAIKKLDLGGIGFITVINDKNIVVGILTDGLFRRAVLKDIKLTNSVSSIMNSEFISLKQEYKKENVLKIFENTVIQHIPVLNNLGELVEIVIEDSFLDKRTKKNSNYSQINLPVVIMAGGKGTRMEPFTHILPKPLIPIGEKPMIEVIMDEYAKFGMKDFYISINHKGKMIKAYLEDHEGDYSFKYISEDKFLGTAGALKYLDGKLDSPFFVSNCDIIIRDDYTKIYDFHKKGNYALTLVASMQHHTIPYGVCEIENGGDLKSITEKPQYDFLVNTGMYILNPEVLKHIPENEFFHITHLMEKLKKEGLKIGVYPVSEKSYIDVGQWSEYKNAMKMLEDI